MAPSKDPPSEVFDYRFIRMLVGALAFALPILLVVIAKGMSFPVAPSISEFFFTPAREVLVGTIGAISIFLLCYNGHPIDRDRAAYDWRERFVPDRLLSLVASLGALGVAFFPVKSDLSEGLSPSPMFVTLFGEGSASGLHQASALAFFVALTWFCLDNFQRSPIGVKAQGKRVVENQVYRICGYILLACTLGLIAIGAVGKWGDPALRDSLDAGFAVLIFEAIALFAFAVSWLTKGKTISQAKRGLRALRNINM